MNEQAEEVTRPRRRGERRPEPQPAPEPSEPAGVEAQAETAEVQEQPPALFVDILIILRRYRAQFEARRLAHPVVFWMCSIIGGLASLVGIIATLSGSWTPLISNSAGSISILGAVVSYGTWFWWVGGITVISLAVAVLLYLAGHRAGDRPAQVSAGAPRAASAGGVMGADG